MRVRYATHTHTHTSHRERAVIESKTTDSHHHKKARVHTRLGIHTEYDVITILCSKHENDILKSIFFFENDSSRYTSTVVNCVHCVKMC